MGKPQSTHMADPTNDHPRRRLTFDPTINAGHILTFVTLVAAMVVGWNTLDKRVVVLEEAKRYQQERDDTQDRVLNDKLGDIKETLRDVKIGVEQLKDNQRKNHQP